MGWDELLDWLTQERQRGSNNWMESVGYRQKAQAGIVPPSGMLVSFSVKLSIYDDLNL